MCVSGVVCVCVCVCVCGGGGGGGYVQTFHSVVFLSAALVSGSHPD